VGVNSPEPPLPAQTRLDLDASTVLGPGGVLIGGSPRRWMQLSDAGGRALRALLAGEATSPAALALGRRLTDANLAHPRPGPLLELRSITVVIPVRGRTQALAACRASLPAGVEVIVIEDDGPVTLGPAAARNAGIERVTTPFIAFVDSDVVLGADALQLLSGHLGADPLLAAVAPRVRSIRDGPGRIDRYLHERSPLDMGALPACVKPGSRVGYVPSTVLLVRSDALARVGGFDAGLRYGEDVDLVWRLLDAGWRARYDPAVVVGHDEPRTVTHALGRRFVYGTSAAALATRHPGKLRSPRMALPWREISSPLALVDELAYLAGSLTGRRRSAASRPR
jgi:GT2 family glycosyltransferase